MQMGTFISQSPLDGTNLFCNFWLSLTGEVFLDHECSRATSPLHPKINNSNPKGLED